MQEAEKCYRISSSGEYTTEEEALKAAQKYVGKYQSDYFVFKAVKKVIYPVPKNEVIDLT